MNGDGMVGLLDYREDGITPYMLFFKDGLIVEKCVSTVRRHHCEVTWFIIVTHSNQCTSVQTSVQKRCCPKTLMVPGNCINCTRSLYLPLFCGPLKLNWGFFFLAVKTWNYICFSNGPADRLKEHFASCLENKLLQFRTLATPQAGWFKHDWSLNTVLNILSGFSQCFDCHRKEGRIMSGLLTERCIFFPSVCILF